MSLQALHYKWGSDVRHGVMQGNRPVIAEWRGEAPQPSQEEVDAAVVEYAAYNESVAYRDRRKAAYASIGDQLDMQYWDAVNDTSIWVDHIERVKRDHPKPE